MCLGKVARRAAIFSDQMCETILSGFRQQLVHDRKMRPNEFGLNILEAEMVDCDEELQAFVREGKPDNCLLYTSPSPRD